MRGRDPNLEESIPRDLTSVTTTLRLNPGCLRFFENPALFGLALVDSRDHGFAREGRSGRGSPSHFGECAANLKTCPNQLGVCLSIVELTIIHAHCQRTSVTLLKFPGFPCVHVFPVI